MKWPERNLIDVADLQLGKMLDAKKNRGRLMPYLANVNVRWGRFDLDALREMRFESGETERYGLRPGDIVMCEGGEPGRCALWLGEQQMMIQKALHRIRAGADLDSRFLYYQLYNAGRRGRFAPLFTGSTIKHLPRRNLAKVAVRVPPLPVQRKIASTLSAYDDLIAVNRKRIARLEEAARLVYREWFVHLRFPGHESTPVVDGVPEGWERLTVGDLGHAVSEGVDPESVDPETVYVGLAHIPRRSITLNAFGQAEEATSRKMAFQPGDVLFGRIRPYFHKVSVARDHGITSSDVIVVRPSSAQLSSTCILTLSSDRVIAFASQTMNEGSKMPRANWKLIRGFGLLLPNSELLDIFNSIINPVLKQLDTLQRQNAKLKEARDLLLPRLMSGEVAV